MLPTILRATAAVGAGLCVAKLRRLPLSSLTTGMLTALVLSLLPQGVLLCSAVVLLASFALGLTMYAFLRECFVKQQSFTFESSLVYLLFDLVLGQTLANGWIRTSLLPYGLCRAVLHRRRGLCFLHPLAVGLGWWTIHLFSLPAKVSGMLLGLAGGMLVAMLHCRSPHDSAQPWGYLAGLCFALF